jgi:hypothetical protein
LCGTTGKKSLVSGWFIGSSLAQKWQQIMQDSLKIIHVLVLPS